MAPSSTSPPSATPRSAPPAPPAPLASASVDSPESMFPDASHPPGSSDPIEISEWELLRRLEQKRNEIDSEIEAFKSGKEQEYRDFKQRLRDEQRIQSNKKRKREKAAGKKSDSTKEEEEKEKSDASSMTTDGGEPEKPQIPTKDKLPEAAPLMENEPPKDKGEENTSPPFERELQEAGLFTPSSLALRPKSPKRVTFQFEDENSVPSRSSPPAPKIKWGFGEPEDDSGGFACESAGDEAVQVSQEEFDADFGGVEQVENVDIKFSGPVVPVGVNPAERSHGDELVVPTKANDTESAGIGSWVEGPSPNNDSGFVSGAIAGKKDPWASLRNGNGATPMGGGTNGFNSSRGAAAPRGNAIDDDSEDDLFDMDETIPAVDDPEPPHRDPCPQAPLRSPPPPSFTSSLPKNSPFNRSTSVPASVPSFSTTSEGPISFGKTPITFSLPSDSLRGSLSSSFSTEPTGFAQLRQKSESSPAIASSLPSIGWGRGPSFTPTPGGRFRRRSIAKYDIPEDDEGIEFASRTRGKDIPEETEMSRSPYATSVPMEITRPSSFHLSPVSKSPETDAAEDIPDETPLSARPSPEPSPDLPAITGFLSIHDSAELLADAPTSSTFANLKDDDAVSSYRRTSPFPSAPSTPYRNSYAAEVAVSAALENGSDAGIQSVVGGVDGKTGLDPDCGSFSYSGLSFRGGAAAGKRRGSVAGTFEEMRPDRMSLSMRMAMEDQMEEEEQERGNVGGVGVGGAAGASGSKK